MCLLLAICKLKFSFLVAMQLTYNFVQMWLSVIGCHDMASYGGGSLMQVVQGTNHWSVGWQASHSQPSILGEFFKTLKHISFRTFCRPFFLHRGAKIHQKKKKASAQDTSKKSCNYEKVLEKQHVQKTKVKIFENLMCQTSKKNLI